MSIQITCGVNELSSDAVVGKTIREIKSDFSSALGIPADAAVIVNDTRVDNLDHQAVDGDEIEFVRTSGTKG